MKQVVKRWQDLPWILRCPRWQFELMLRIRPSLIRWQIRRTAKALRKEVGGGDVHARYL